MFFALDSRILTAENFCKNGFLDFHRNASTGLQATLFVTVDFKQNFCQYLLQIVFASIIIGLTNKYRVGWSKKEHTFGSHFEILFAWGDYFLSMNVFIKI